MDKYDVTRIEVEPLMEGFKTEYWGVKELPIFNEGFFFNKKHPFYLSKVKIELAFKEGKIFLVFTNDHPKWLSSGYRVDHKNDLHLPMLKILSVLLGSKVLTSFAETRQENRFIVFVLHFEPSSGEDFTITAIKKMRMVLKTIFSKYEDRLVSVPCICKVTMCCNEYSGSWGIDREYGVVLWEKILKTDKE